MNYLYEDFNRCSYNPMEDNLPNAYPELGELFDLKKEDTVRILRYAMAVYDPYSPLIQDYPDPLGRKVAGAALAGFDLEREEKFLLAMYSGLDDGSLELIHRYLRLCIRSREWAMIVSNEETFWEYNMRLKLPITKAEKDKDMMSAIQAKSELAKDQEVFHERIKRLTKEFFGGDEDMAKAAESNFRMNPQQVAKQLAKNK